MMFIWIRLSQRKNAMTTLHSYIDRIKFLIVTNFDETKDTVVLILVSLCIVALINIFFFAKYDDE